MDPVFAMQRILVPSDFSAVSDSALRYGKALAEAFRASLHLLHVLESPLSVAPAMADSYVLAPDFLARIERAAAERLRGALSDAEQASYRARLVVRQGTPFLEIVHYAREESIDLIVMGSHGHGPVAHLMLGNVAERVVRNAPCPVLTVRSPEHEFVLP
jgi:nucleotide-binding universal stress UspA family protein